MRKLSLSLFITVWGSFWLSAQVLDITHPTRGETLCLGRTHTITWTSTGAVGAEVFISALNEDSGTWTDIGWTDNDLSHPWPIPATLAAGEYTLTIRNRERSAIDRSPAFHIADCAAPPPPTPEIIVTGPAAGFRVGRGSTLAVRWTHGEAMDGRVQLRLVQPASEAVIRDICLDTEDDDSYDWPVPLDAPIGNCRVQVKVLGGETSGCSGVFEIIGKTRREETVTELTVVKPAAGDVLYVGEETTFIWKSPTADAIAMPCGEEVNLTMVRIGKAFECPVAVRYANHEGTNRLTQSLYPGYYENKTGSYKLRIESPNGCRTESGVFRIENRIRPADGSGVSQAANPADVIGCDYGVKSLVLNGGRGLDTGVEIRSDNLLVDLAAQVQWSRRGPEPGTLSLEIYSPLSGRRLDKHSAPASFSAAQADGSGVITVNSSIAIEGREKLLSVLRGRFLPVEVRLIPSNSECDGLASNNRREFNIRVSNPPAITDLKLEIEADTLSIRYMGRGERGRGRYNISYWVKARNLTPNEAGGPGETLYRVRCSHKVLERSSGAFNTLYEHTFAFPEVRYGSDWRMELIAPIEIYRDSGNPLSCVLLLDPEERTYDPNRENNRGGMVIHLPD